MPIESLSRIARNFPCLGTAGRVKYAVREFVFTSGVVPVEAFIYQLDGTVEQII